MIEMLRLDERLIHGQVATQWLNSLDVDSVIVCDDNAASNSMLKNALMLAAPRNMKTVVKSCDDTINLLQDPRCAQRKVFVVTGQMAYIEKIVKSCDDIKIFVIGNYGSINKNNDVRTKYADTVFLTEDEVSQLEEIIKENKFPSYYWSVPAVGKLELEKVLSK